MTRSTELLLWGALAFAAACSSPGAAQTAAPAPASPPRACAGPEHQQFDFWVGHWDVFPTGKPKMVAHSVIEKLYGGCTIRENWLPLNNPGGGSLNMYEPSDKRWHQTWHDNSNARVEFHGGLAGNRMVLTGFWPGVNGPGQDGLIRMTYTPNADKSVRQHGEISTDHGLSWSTSFDFTYKRSAPSPAK
jgi:hypothetical protein